MPYRRPGRSQQLGEDRFVALPLVLQGLDSDVEPRQRDVVVKIEGISGLFVHVLARPQRSLYRSPCLRSRSAAAGRQLSQYCQTARGD
jgi:hypothetical protein